MKRFEALEGFRAVLAWWVVISHMLMFARISGSEMPMGLTVLRQGIIPVYVFIIISGFVITHLLTQKDEPYLVYVMRRFLRLWPVFAVVVTIVALANAIGLQIRNPGEDLWLHYIAEMTMFHGLIPNEVLDNASMALSGPGWSISLEWQFYLIAPLMLAAFTTKHWLRWPVCAIVLLIASTGALGTEMGWIELFGERWTYDKPSAIFLALPYFGLGMACYWVFRNFQGRVQLTIPAMLLIAALALGFARANQQSTALFVWAFLFCILLSQSGFVYEFFKMNWLKRAGDISYSTYITHVVVLDFMVEYVIPRSNDEFMHFLTILVMSTPVIIAVSLASYYWLEKPAIRLGHRLAERMQTASGKG